MVEVFATAAATERYAALRDAAPRWTLVDDQALASLSDTVHPQGVVAVCRFLDRPLEHLLASRPRPVRWSRSAPTSVTPATRAPWSAAPTRPAPTRSCWPGDSVDAYNPKTVRATVGSLFHLPLAITDAAAVRARAREAGLLVLAADGAGEVDLDDGRRPARRPTAWLFGNEAWGLPADLAVLADHRVRIPLHGRAESLNLSTAAALCLYASARAHRRQGGHEQGGHAPLAREDLGATRG